MPFCFLGAATILFAKPIAQLSFIIADKGLTGLWFVLTFLANLNYATWHIAMPNNSILLLTCIGTILLIAPRGLPGKCFSFIFFLPLLTYHAERPKIKDYWLTLLDVGQGLSVVIETKQHTLLYDAGPRFNVAYDMGQTVVLPFLRSQRINVLDKLIISPGDNDHIGGAYSLLKALEIKSIATSTPEKIMTPITQYCLINASWEWDGVKFSMLYPSQKLLGLGNDSSCVLLIDNGYQRTLLTGDIEKYAEKVLTQTENNLHADLLIAPHHGSKTSIFKKFVLNVHPQYVLYSTGYLNRYKFPHRVVQQLYATLHAQQYNTALQGAIQFKMIRGQSIEHPQLYRYKQKRFWRNE